MMVFSFETLTKMLLNKTELLSQMRSQVSHHLRCATNNSLNLKKKLASKENLPSGNKAENTLAETLQAKKIQKEKTNKKLLEPHPPQNTHAHKKNSLIKRCNMRPISRYNRPTSIKPRKKSEKQKMKLRKNKFVKLQPTKKQTSNRTDK